MFSVSPSRLRLQPALRATSSLPRQRLWPFPENARSIFLPPPPTPRSAVRRRLRDFADLGTARAHRGRFRPDRGRTRAHRGRTRADRGKARAHGALVRADGGRESAFFRWVWALCGTAGVSCGVIEARQKNRGARRKNRGARRKNRGARRKNRSARRKNRSARRQEVASSPPGEGARRPAKGCLGRGSGSPAKSERIAAKRAISSEEREHLSADRSISPADRSIPPVERDDTGADRCNLAAEGGFSTPRRSHAAGDPRHPSAIPERIAKSPGRGTARPSGSAPSCWRIGGRAGLAASARTRRWARLPDTGPLRPVFAAR